MIDISVIIPVYNAETTLNRSIDSILNQNWDGNILEDIEIILVDDIKAMRPGLPELLFEEVIRISKLSDTDLTVIKTFRKNE